MKTKTPGLVILFLMIFGSLQAQITGNEMPGIGDHVFYQSINVNTFNELTGTIGLGVTWDYHAVNEISDSTVYDYIDPALTPAPEPDSFPNSTVAEAISAGTGHYFYTQTGNAFYRDGIWDANSVMLKYSNPLKRYTLPFSFGTSYTDNYAGTGNLTGGIDSVYINNGSYTFDVQGVGTLKLPNGTFYNVYRIYYTEDFAVKFNQISPGTILFSISEYGYEYWQAGVVRPILTFSNSTYDDMSGGHQVTKTVSYQKKLAAHSITISPGNDTTFCIGPQYTLTAHIPLFASTFHWKVDGTIVSPPVDSVLTLNTTTLGIGHHVVKAIITFGSNPVQTDYDSVIVTVLPIPHVDLGPDISICSGPNHLLDAGNGGLVNYQWSVGSHTQTITVTQPGIYWVAVNNICGIDADTVQLSPDLSNVADLGPDQTLCLHDSAHLYTNNMNIVNYHWSCTPANIPSIPVWLPGSYSLTTTDNLGCISSDEIQISVITPYALQEICFVEYDTLTNKNKINWKQHTGVGIDSVEILKEITLNVWGPIGVVPNSDSSFIDINSTPQNNSDSYRLSIVDSCGNRSGMSQSHATITLVTSYTPGTNTIGFTWSHYLVAGSMVAPTYTIYGVDNNNITHQIGSVPGSQNYYNWTNADTSYHEFFVGFSMSCFAKSNYLVRSNYVSNPVGIEEWISNKIGIYPNPARDILYVTSDYESAEAQLFDVVGQLITSIQIHQKAEISLNSLPAGVYILKVKTKDGEVSKKVVKE